MRQQLSKADRIRKLLHLSNAEIAERLGCRQEYVRTVRQRTSSNGHPVMAASDKAWNAANPNYFVEYRAKRRAEARAS